MYFFDCSLPEVKLIRRPAFWATSVNVTGNGRPDGASRAAGGELRVTGPCAAANTTAAASSSIPRRRVMNTIVVSARWLAHLNSSSAPAPPGLSSDTNLRADSSCFSDNVMDLTRYRHCDILHPILAT